MSSDDLVHRLLPEFDFEERHRILGVVARPEALRTIIASLDDHGDAWLNALLWLREWPARAVYRWRPDLGIAPQQPRFGLGNFTRLADDETGLVFGMVGSFWRLNFGLQAVADERQFLAARSPGAAKLVLGFQWAQGVDGRLDLETVTRIQCTDAAARRRMALYWALIRPFSGLIRRRILRQVRRVSLARR